MNEFLEQKRWLLVIAVVLVILGCIQLLRVNAPQQAMPEEKPFVATVGPVLDGRYTVPAGDFLAVRIDLNRRASLTGRFRTPERKMLVGCTVLDAANFEAWKNGSEYKRLAETGYIPGGKINLALEPGNYYLILDNRNSNEDRIVEAHFSVD